MGWLRGQFGEERLRESSFVVPTNQFFPDRYDNSEPAARNLFCRTCGFMGIDPAGVELEFYQPTHRPGLARSLIRSRLEWAGRFQLREERNLVQVDVTLLPLPESLLAVFAHELAHQLLLGSKRICECDRDHELVTDLTTAFFGMGIFNANESLRNQYRLNRRGDEIGRLGYLTPAIWGYALALCAWSREEDKPAWTHWLRPQIRRIFWRSLAYLRRTGDAQMVDGGQLDEHSRIAFLKAEYPEFASGDVNWGEAADPEQDDWGVDSHVRDDVQDRDEMVALESKSIALLAEAAQRIQAGEWDDAHRCLSEAIRIEPDNGAAYQQRAWVLLELAMFDDALRDAETAARLEPDDSESYLTRGAAYLKVRQFELAIDDLTRYVAEEDVYSATGHHASRAYYLRGLAYAGLRNFSQAMKDYGRAINRWPDWPDPYEARAEAHEFFGNSQLAGADRDQARRRAAP